jgi:hypothetical protein
MEVEKDTAKYTTNALNQYTAVEGRINTRSATQPFGGVPSGPAAQ